MPGNHQSSKIQFNNLSEGIEVQIYAERNIVRTLFLSCWIGGWAAGEYSVIEILSESPFEISKLPLFLWLACWTTIGIFVIFIWLWNFAGKENIRIDGKKLKHKRFFTLFSRSHEYLIDDIKNLHVSPKNTSMFKFKYGIRYWGLSGGLINFDYQQSSFRFASDIKEDEAKLIVKKIIDRFPKLESTSNNST